MTVEPGWIPPGIDTTKANVARVYDYWLGGDHNFQGRPVTSEVASPRGSRYADRDPRSPDRR